MMADIPSSADRFLLQVYTSLAKSFRQIRLELGRPPTQVSDEEGMDPIDRIV